MCKSIVLNDRQRQLVERHMAVVDWVLFDYITANEGVVGLAREDLRQEGYVWLCQAAATYDGVSASFGTYARKVVRNGLISHCRKVNGQPKPLSLEQAYEEGGAEPHVGDRAEEIIDSADTAALLGRLKEKYSGVTKLGIEALELKIKGLDGTEIAALYGVQSNHVSAWISRAAQKLRKDEQFLAHCSPDQAVL